MKLHLRKGFRRRKPGLTEEDDFEQIDDRRIGTYFRRKRNYFRKNYVYIQPTLVGGSGSKEERIHFLIKSN